MSGQYNGSNYVKSIIYGLVDPRDMLIHYVGKSVQGLKRARAHQYQDKRAGNPSRLAWLNELSSSGRRYDIAVLECISAPHTSLCWWWTGLNTSPLNDAERWWIAYGRACGWPLLNQTAGGEGLLGMRHSESACKKIGDAHRGLRHSDEARAKMSLAKKGRPLTPTHNVNKAAAQRGLIRSLETRAAISAGKRGMVFSAEHRAKLSVAAKARCERLGPPRRSR